MSRTEFDPTLPAPGLACAYPAMPPPVRVRLATFPSHPCNYLPGRTATTRAFLVRDMPGDVYHDFMNAGFRRSGQVIYQPVCAGCRECRPIRVPVATFEPSKSQRRARRRNADLRIHVGPPDPTDEKHELYRRYLTLRHDRSMDDARESMEQFLYRSPVQTIEFAYRDPSGRLLAVGICDACERSLSSVYFFFEPDESKRGLGTFGALAELDFAAAAGIPHYYLGFWIHGCDTMEYKSNFRPCEVLHPDGVWRPP